MVVVLGWPGVKIREMELQAEERRLLIEKGLEISALSGAPNAGAITDMFIQLLLKRGAPQPDGIGSLAHYQLTKDKPREEAASAPGPLR